MAMKNCVETYIKDYMNDWPYTNHMSYREPYIGIHKSSWSKLTARKFCAIKGVKAVSLVN